MDYVFDGLLLVLAIIIGLYYLYEKKVVKKRVFSNINVVIPGLLKSHVRLGNLMELNKYGSLHQFLVHLHNKYGKVASFYWMDTLVVSICDYNSFKNIKHLTDRPHIIFENFKSFIGEECIQFANGIEIRDRRKCYDQSFSQEALIRYVKIMEEIGKEEIKNIGSLPSLTLECAATTGLTMAIRAIMQCHIAPNKKEEFFLQRIIYLYSIIWGGLTDRLINMKNFINTDSEEVNFQEAQKEFHSIIRDIVLSRIKMLDDEDGDTYNKADSILIDDIIHFHGDVNIEVIIKEVLVYLIGGFHTSGNLLCWSLYYLSKHEEYQEKIFQEIVQNKIIFSNHKECLDSMNNMPFLQACIREVLRVCELAPYSARFSPEDITVGQYLVKANTPIIIAQGVSFSDPEVFKQPEIFNPFRFIDETFPSLSFVPFGFAGKRKCPGEKFAYLEISIWLIQFIKNYKFALKNPGEEVQKVYGLVTHMDRPVSIVFTHRNQGNE